MHERCLHQVAQFHLETWADQLRPGLLEGNRSGARAAAFNYLPICAYSRCCKAKGFQRDGPVMLSQIDSWPLASIELERTSMTLQAKERGSADGQWWFVDEIAILDKIKSALGPRRISLKARSPWPQASRCLTRLRTRMAALATNRDNDESIRKTSPTWAPHSLFYTDYCHYTWWLVRFYSRTQPTPESGNWV